MNEWLVVAIVLIGALLPCLAVCLLSGATHALAAFEVASTLLATVLMLLSEGFHRQPFIDLALTFTVMSIVGALAFARLMERDV
jgi:multisubunit Na+/H+ antiporter MnhF subunit